MRVEEALSAAERFLDELFTRGEAGVYLIHGHGTGTLKRAVRAALRESAYVSAIRPGRREEGGDGVTAARLRRALL